jgi:alpha-tubulin suppressor-like RCC1 family protein
VPESHGSACQPSSILRIAAGAEFSVVSVNDVVGMIGNGYPRLPGTPPGPRFVEFCIPAESAAALPWHGSPIKHLVAGSEHVLIGCVCDKRLRVWGWGSNHYRQLGFPGFANVFDKPMEIVYDCPVQASDAFPSMLAASDSSSMIMVNGQVWAMGQHECANFKPTPTEPTFYYSTVMHVKAIDPQFFDNRPIAYVGTGPRHAAFVTTCGRLYLRGYSTYRGSFFYESAGDNGLPTSCRSTKRGVIGICEKKPLAHPLLMSSELLGGQACGLVCEPLARKLAFLMGTHARLRVKDGAGSAAAGFAAASLDSLLLKMILDVCDALLPALVRA